MFVHCVPVSVTHGSSELEVSKRPSEDEWTAKVWCPRTVAYYLSFTKGDSGRDGDADGPGGTGIREPHQ